MTYEEASEGGGTSQTTPVIPDDELWLHTPAVAASLDRALAWSDSHPRRKSALKTLAKKIDTLP